MGSESFTEAKISSPSSKFMIVPLLYVVQILTIFGVFLLFKSLLFIVLRFMLFRYVMFLVVLLQQEYSTMMSHI